MQIDIDIEDPRWNGLQLSSLVQRAATAVAAHFALDGDLCELSVLACDDDAIADLNAEFRDKPRPTNVLSWPAQERGAAEDGETPTVPVPDIFNTIALGDLAIAYETCMQEAQEQSKTPQSHVLHLLIHGILHLLGYDHIRSRDADLMEGIEITILGTMGISDPYTM
ncbi:rRNA maturation RNase YbeY [Thioclava sp. SK-1]|uniref:rRNA maturation RNase YbeY n=1 Tax=Thioclava sp. SK-1 TaxID=1889770 RepID=UPI000824AE7D|nr:rRNA maturation RNase YbeY [Thioclava sp. SK-1]OCX66522.1 rRNA maturation RNase YbeY [Thioclava sp. SK-1]